MDHPSEPSALQVYDFFNNLYKPNASESKGLHCSNPNSKVKRLICEWKFQEDKFNLLTAVVRKDLGEEWYKIFSRIREGTAKENKTPKGQTVFKISGDKYRLEPQ